MASRSRPTFQKRQKEMKRQEKQRMKAERRALRNLAKRTESETRIDGVDAPIESFPPADSEPPADAEPPAGS